MTQVVGHGQKGRDKLAREGVPFGIGSAARWLAICLNSVRVSK